MASTRHEGLANMAYGMIMKDNSDYTQHSTKAIVTDSSGIRIHKNMLVRKYCNSEFWPLLGFSCPEE